jgi:proline iminopeptidase
MKKVFFTFLFFSSIIMLTNCGDSENKENKEDEDKQEVIKIEKSQETVEINGVKHFIEKMGNGEPLLVLHGGPGLFHDYLVPHFEILAKKYQIIFYDQRGCGKTEFPKDTSSINIETYIEDLEGIRNHLKIDKLNLVGHSWGTMVALNYAKKYSKNLNKLILVSPTPSNSDFFDQTFENMQKKRTEEDTKDLIQTMMSKEFENREETPFRKATLLSDKVNLVDQNKVEELYQPMNFNPATASNLMIVSSLLEKTYFNFDITVGLDVVDCPTLILIGDLENVPFSSTQLLQESIKGSRLEVIKKACHYPFFETPKEFNQSIKNFLDPEYEQ